MVFLTFHGVFCSIAMAQVVITSDGSVGTQVNQNGNVHNITGGRRPGGGGNLFHSFGEFGVPVNNIANFLNDSSLPTSNILSRVTGGNPSNILGTIQTEGFGNANLFLMNPAGVMFGKDATLNVGGAIHFTTADYLQLSDGVQFSALPSEQDGLLSVAPVEVFGFLEPNPASLSVGGSTLAVGEGETLSLVGGDIEFSGGNLNSSDGHINLVSVTSPGTVILGEGGDIQVNAPQLGQIDLTSSSSVNVDGESGGTIVIRGGNLMVDGSQISANATGSSSASMAGANVSGIDIEVSKDVVLDNQSIVAADVNGSRDGRYISVMAGENLEIHNSILRTLATPGSTGNAGHIEVQAENVLFNINERGQGFNVLGISSQAVGAGGDSGSIEINSNSFQMIGGFIATVTFGFPIPGGIVGGPGKVGNIELNVKDDISIIGGPGGGNIVANAIGASGNAGDVLIHANNLTLSGNSALQAVSAVGPGDAGTIQIDLKGNLDLREASQIGSFSQMGGDAGDITINAKDVSLTGVANPIADGTPSGDQTLITALTTGGGEGGNVNIKAENFVGTNKAILITTTRGSGDGGKISILSGGDFTLTNGASVRAESSSQNVDAGNAGDIQFTAADTILLDGATVTTEAAQASGGNIKLTAEDLIRLNDSTISSSVQGSATTQGGDINIDPDFIVLQNSQILAKAVEGQGGNISLIANNAVLVDPLSVLDASSALGVSGSVDIQAPIQNLSGTLAPLPEETTPVTALYGARCAAGQGGHFSTFVDSKAGNLSLTPGAFLASPLLLSSASTNSVAASSVRPSSPVVLTASIAPLVLGYAGEPTTACP